MVKHFVFQLYLHDGQVLEEFGHVPLAELRDCKTDDLKNKLIVRYWSNWAWGLEPNGKRHLMGRNLMLEDSFKYLIMPPDDGKIHFYKWRKDL